jgi:hypothetical protein
MNAMLLNEFLKEHRKNEHRRRSVARTRYARDLLNLRSDLTVDVLQRDRVNACQVYFIERY